MKAFFAWWQAIVAALGAGAAGAVLASMLFTSVATPSVHQDNSALFKYGTEPGQ